MVGGGAGICLCPQATSISSTCLPGPWDYYLFAPVMSCEATHQTLFPFDCVITGVGFFCSTTTTCRHSRDRIMATLICGFLSGFQWKVVTINSWIVIFLRCKVPSNIMYHVCTCVCAFWCVLEWKKQYSFMMAKLILIWPTLLYNILIFPITTMHGHRFIATARARLCQGSHRSFCHDIKMIKASVTCLGI